MSKGHALLVGLKSIDPCTYNGWDGRNGCWGCELDVDNIHRILKPKGYSISVLKTTEATSSNVLNGIRTAASKLKSGDIFVFYYSGHGSQQPDVNGDELDGHDETLVLYDRQITDDHLNEVWPEFSDGVRIVMVSDSCNSGNNYRGVRDVPSNMALPICLSGCLDGKNMNAQMIHYSGCREDQTAMGYVTGGAFTMAFCRALVHGGVTNYPALYDQTCAWLRANGNSPQEPQYSRYGPVSKAFETSRPFSIELMENEESEVREALRSIPISWLHEPSLAKEHSSELSGVRIAPFVATVIGVAIGAGIQLTSQALSRSVARSRPDVSEVRCDLPINEIERLALDNMNLIHSPGVNLLQEIERKCAGERILPALPVPVVAFLVGVATGAAAARP